MTGIAVGCGQITWMTGPADKPKATEEQVLAEIAQAGYEGAPAGLKAGRSAQELLELYGRYGLRPAPGYLGAAFWDAGQTEQILEQARQYAKLMREVGCAELYVAASGFDHVTASGQTRKQVAAHVGPNDGLTDDQYQRFAETLNRVGAITLKEGVRSCFHNHVGSVIETHDEIERLLELVDPQLIFLGPDTGHLAWAGVDVLDFCRRYADRIKTLHVKDIDAAVLERGRAAQWDYDTFTKNGIFTELGEGCVDFPALFDILRQAGFQGWVIAETDVTQKPTALESVTISRAYLKSIGL